MIALLTDESEEITTLLNTVAALQGSIEMILQHYRPVMNGDMYLSGEQVCKLLHISKRTLQQYRDDKILPYIQIGGKIIFKQSDILSVLTQNYSTAK
jgi:excisionase family DNA binding protein